jgi:hypothetical protein
MPRIVVVAHEDRWVVKQEGSDFSIAERDSREAALEAAREHVAENPVDELLVDEDADGRVTPSDARGN